jgi:hypothetical protein
MGFASVLELPNAQWNRDSSERSTWRIWSGPFKCAIVCTQPSKMAGRRAHIILPEELVEEIDQLVGRRGRSGFIARAATAEIKRVRQLKALQKAAGSWKDENHPELAVGAASWVSHLRKESDESSNARRR